MGCKNNEMYLFWTGDSHFVECSFWFWVHKFFPNGIRPADNNFVTPSQVNRGRNLELKSETIQIPASFSMPKPQRLSHWLSHFIEMGHRKAKNRKIGCKNNQMYLFWIRNSYSNEDDNLFCWSSGLFIKSKSANKVRHKAQYGSNKGWCLILSGIFSFNTSP